ncbi:MAG: hypothetical protein KA792_08935, partial [Bacteroidales bacterium]|nr:hypothetical protein [Bacteroidales bacterium]
MDNNINKNQVYNLIILDESGSMQSIKNFIIKAFNNLTDNIRTITKKFPMQQHYFSLITFNGYGVKKHYWHENIEKIITLSNKDYIPDENTPLLDTLGIVITKLK